MIKYVVICDEIESAFEDSGDFLRPVPQGWDDVTEEVQHNISSCQDEFEDFPQYIGAVVYRKSDTNIFSERVLRAECDDRRDAVAILQWGAERIGECMPGDEIGEDYINRYLYEYEVA